MSDTQTKDMAKSPPGVREGSDLAGAGRAGGGNSDGGKSGGTWIGLAVLAMLFLASIALIRKADDTKPPDWEESRLTYLPSGKILKPLAMDLDEAMAAILWIRGMLYFSGAYLQGKEYEWMGHILDIVTTLNPHFKQAYEFGGVVLTKNKAELPKTLKLLDRGIETFPRDWKLRVYAALAQINLDSNYVKAAAYLEPMAGEAEVPNHIRVLAATLMDKGGSRRMALAFLLHQAVHTGNAINREIFVDKILKLYGRREAPVELKRKTTVETVLREVSLEPMGETIGVEVLHAFLSDSLTDKTRHMLKLLDP